MEAHKRQVWLKTVRTPAILLLTACFFLLVPIRAQTAPFLRIGSTGESVEMLQETLSALGYYAARVDGIFGPITDKAVGHSRLLPASCLTVSWGPLPGRLWTV